MAVDITLPVLQIVGYQNSGKTTLIEKLIKKSTNKGLRPGSIKHHGHGGEPQADKGRDTHRHREAGAICTTVEGGGLLQLHAQKEEWSLDEMLTIYHHLPVDVVFVEGWKKIDLPKVVMIRSQDDIALLNEVHSIVAVISWIPFDHEAYTIFMIDEDHKYIDWLLQKVGI
jgi:molybdopterin-guanine dinucleotide biosynthesis adapter protein